MQHLYIFSVWLHIVAACLWIGGMLFLVLIVVPVMRRLDDPRASSALFHKVALRFRTAGWWSLAILAMTGTFNLLHRGMGYDVLTGSQFWGGGFGGALAIKLALVTLIVTLSVVHDFVLGPRASALARTAPSDPRAERLRKSVAWMGRVNLLLALAIIALGVMLVRGVP
jgi:uncharacterized membrane protein